MPLLSDQAGTTWEHPLLAHHLAKIGALRGKGACQPTALYLAINSTCPSSAAARRSPVYHRTPTMVLPPRPSARAPSVPPCRL